MVNNKIRQKLNQYNKYIVRETKSVLNISNLKNEILNAIRTVQVLNISNNRSSQAKQQQEYNSILKQVSEFKEQQVKELELQQRINNDIEVKQMAVGDDKSYELKLLQNEYELIQNKFSQLEKDLQEQVLINLRDKGQFSLDLVKLRSEVDNLLLNQQRLKELNENQTAQIAQLKLSNVDKDKIAESLRGQIDKLNAQSISQKILNQELQFNIDSLKGQYQAEIDGLQEQIQYLKQLQNDLNNNNINDELKNIIKQLRDEIVQKDKELNILQQDRVNVQTSMNLVKQELELLQKQKQQQVDNSIIDKRVQQVQQQYEYQLKQKANQYQQLDNKYQQKIKEYDIIKQKSQEFRKSAKEGQDKLLEQLNQEMNNVIQSKNKQIQDLTQQYQSSALELQTYVETNKLMEDQIQQLYDQSEKKEQLQYDNVDNVDDMEIEIDNIQDNRQDVNIFKYEFDNQIYKNNDQFQSNKNIIDKQHKVQKSLYDKIQSRYTQMANSLNAENQNLNKKIARLQNQILGYQDSQKQVTDLKLQNQLLDERFIQLNKEYQQKLLDNTQQINQQQEDISNLEQEIDMFGLAKTDFQLQIQRLNEQLKANQKATDSRIAKIQQYSTKNILDDQNVKQLQAQLRLAISEKTSVQTRFQTTEQNYKRLQKQIKISETQYKANIQKAVENALEDQKNKQINKVKELLDINNSVEVKKILLMNDNTVQQIFNLCDHITKLDQKIIKIEEDYSKKQQLQEQSIANEDDNDDDESRFVMTQELYQVMHDNGMITQPQQTQQQQYQQDKSQFEKVVAQIEGQLNEKDILLKQQQETIEKLNKEIKKLQDQETKYVLNIEKLNQQILEARKEFQKFKADVVLEAQKLISDHKVEINNLKISIQELEKSIIQKDNLIQDLDKRYKEQQDNRFIIGQGFNYEMEQLKNQLQQAHNERQDLINQSAEQIQSLKDQLANNVLALENQNSINMQLREEAQSNKSIYETNIMQAKQQIQALQDELRSYHSSGHNSNLTIEQQRQTIIQLENQINQLRFNNDELQKEVNTTRLQFQQLNTTIDQQSKLITTLQDDLQQSRNVVEQLQGIQNQYNVLQQQYQQQHDQIQQLNATFITVQGQYKQLTDQQIMGQEQRKQEYLDKQQYDKDVVKQFEEVAISFDTIDKTALGDEDRINRSIEIFFRNDFKQLYYQASKLISQHKVFQIITQYIQNIFVLSLVSGRLTYQEVFDHSSQLFTFGSDGDIQNLKQQFLFMTQLSNQNMYNIVQQQYNQIITEKEKLFDNLVQQQQQQVTLFQNEIDRLKNANIGNVQSFDQLQEIIDKEEENIKNEEAMNDEISNTIEQVKQGDVVQQVGRLLTQDTQYNLQRRQGFMKNILKQKRVLAEEVYKNELQQKYFSFHYHVDALITQDTIGTSQNAIDIPKLSKIYQIDEQTLQGYLLKVNWSMQTFAPLLQQFQLDKNFYFPPVTDDNRTPGLLFRSKLELYCYIRYCLIYGFVESGQFAYTSEDPRTIINNYCRNHVPYNRFQSVLQKTNFMYILFSHPVQAFFIAFQSLHVQTVKNQRFDNTQVSDLMYGYFKQILPKFRNKDGSLSIGPASYPFISEDIEVKNVHLLLYRSICKHYSSIEFDFDISDRYLLREEMRLNRVDNGYEERQQFFLNLIDKIQQQQVQGGNSVFEQQNQETKSGQIQQVEQYITSKEISQSSETVVRSFVVAFGYDKCRQLFKEVGKRVIKARDLLYNEFNLIKSKNEIDVGNM